VTDSYPFPRASFPNGIDHKVEFKGESEKQNTHIPHTFHPSHNFPKANSGALLPSHYFLNANSGILLPAVPSTGQHFSCTFI
jgi:hypothetical protein